MANKRAPTTKVKSAYERRSSAAMNTDIPLDSTNDWVSLNAAANSRLVSPTTTNMTMTTTAGPASHHHERMRRPIRNAATQHGTTNSATATDGNAERTTELAIMEAAATSPNTTVQPIHRTHRDARHVVVIGSIALPPPFEPTRPWRVPS